MQSVSDAQKAGGRRINLSRLFLVQLRVGNVSSESL